jgi:uncharacterized protein
MQVITPSLFYQHSTCPHWIWHDRFGDPSKRGEVPELAQKLLDQGVVHEAEYVKGMAFDHVAASDPSAAFARTMELMRRGAERIYQGAIEAEVDGALWRGRPDLLERRAGRSRFGDHHYAPVDIKSSHSVHKEQQLQLTLYAVVLGALQGVRPRETAIINVDHERIPFRPDATHVAKTRAKAKEILAVLAGQKPPPRLASKCKRSPWFQECVREAEAANDIALIYDLDSRSHPALRRAGIRTVKDAADMDASALPVIPFCSQAKLERVRLQAQALQTGELRWLARPSIPAAPLRVYFDIEGDPLLDVQYLFGFWIEGDGPPRYVRFLAERPEDERRMWNDFLAWLETLPEEYAVYHYADYERAHTLRLAGEYGSSPAFERFASRYVDLLKTVKESVVFPLYFYSIKDIAKSRFLNYKWRHKKAGGAQSIFWYEEWLETGDRRILQDIVDYNEDDVVATAHLHRWLADRV